MGIDARMYVRIKGQHNWITEEESIRLAYELGQTFGPDNFLTLNDGHYFCRALEIVKPLTDENPMYKVYGNKGMLGKMVIFDHGNNHIAKPDEQFVKINLMTRYYGEGYERGDLSLIIMVAKWLDYHLPGGAVWYGGDSPEGTNLKSFDEKMRYKLMLHFFDVGHKPYTGKAYSLYDKQALCDFCGGIPMVTLGKNKQETCLYNRCAGCGLRVISDRYTGQILYELNDSEDFFEANSALIINGMVSPKDSNQNGFYSTQVALAGEVHE